MSDDVSTEYTVTVTVLQNRPYKDQYGEGWLVGEEWMQNDKPARRFGPSYVVRHPITHVAVEEQYLDKHYQLHRYEGPAFTVRDPITGEVLAARFFVHGREVPPPHLRYEPS